VADWGGGMSVCCTAGPTVASAGNVWPHNVLRYVSLAHANQLSLPRL